MLVGQRMMEFQQKIIKLIQGQSPLLTVCNLL